jgi:hypothetical protein
MGEIIFRFLIGGAVVRSFAILGDILRPKSFAGLFGAAPSIALATLGLMVHQHGNEYAALESRSMIVGASSFLFYAAISNYVLWRLPVSTLVATLALLPIWFLGAFGLCRLLV